MSEYATDLLADLIRAKRSCLGQLRDLGRRQLEFIEEGEMSALLDLLATKQQVIASLQKLERALTPFRGEDPEQRVWRSADARRSCADDLGQCETLLSEILSQEKCSEGALERRRDASAAQLQGIHVASQARRAYTTSISGTSAGLDLTCED
ncbi:MAG: hypothetical protein ACOY3P_22465 [Planctomycetota bacterium]